MQDLRTGPALVQLVSSLYQTLGPDLGCLLVESGVLLTLAGGRFSGYGLLKSGGEAARLVSKLKLEPHLRIRVSDSPVDMLLVENLEGLGRTTSASRLPDLLPFDSLSGWEGEARWRESTLSRMDGEVFSALMRGVPDVAALDFAAWLAMDKILPMEDSVIEGADRYPGPSPNFAFMPEHGTDPTVQDTIRSWSSLLQEFYASPWHVAISADPAFLEARRAHDAG